MINLRDKNKADKSLTSDQRTKIILEEIELKKIKERNKLLSECRANTILLTNLIIGVTIVLLVLILGGYWNNIETKRIDRDLVLRGYIRTTSGTTEIPTYKKVD